jgi:hypothetical protein
VAGSVVVVAIAVVVTIVLTQSGHTPQTSAGATPSGSPQASSFATARPTAYTVTLHTTNTSSASYKADVQFPVVTGMANVTLQKRINTELIAPADHAVAVFKSLNSSAVGSGGAFIAFRDSVYRDGNLLSVKYYYETHNSGAGDVSYGLDALTIPMTTGVPLGSDGILAPAAFTSSGVRRLATDLQLQKGISLCDELPGWRGERGLPPVLAHMSTPGNVVLNVTPAGLEFSFGDDTISPTVCRPVGVLPLTELSGLVTPSIAALSASPVPSASSAGSPSPSATASPQGPAGVVQAYFAAINGHRYRRAWRLGGDHLGESYAQFAAGFATTARDVVRIISVHGGNVAVKLTAIQSDGSRLTFTGTYTVSDGAITSSAITQTG